MPTLDTVKRINVDDFKPEDRETAERIANVYNFFAEQVTNVLNGKVDFENLTRSTLVLDTVVDATGIPVVQTRFRNNVGLRGINVINAVNQTNRVNFVNSTPFVSFISSGDGTYTVENIKGLITGNQYQLTLELIF